MSACLARCQKPPRSRPIFADPARGLQTHIAEYSKRSAGPCHENLILAAQIFAGRFGSCRGSGSPRPKGFLAKDTERAAGCEMALDVESVLDGGVNG
jgi:hypothetical protein